MKDTQGVHHAGTRNSIDDVWGPQRPYYYDWPVRIVRLRPLFQRPRDRHRRQERPDRSMRGRGDDRVNHGRLGPKGLHGWQANENADRLTKPLIRRATISFTK